MKLVVLTAPSGSGKTTIARRLLETVPGMHFSVSATTRPARPGEVDGRDYHFLTPEAFDEMLEQDAFVEHEEVYPGLFYGTPRSELESATSAEPVLLDIDVKGALNVKARYGNSVFVVFIRAPSLDELERRLSARATESAHSVGARMARARDELKFEGRFDQVIVNDDLEEAVSETIARVRAFLSAPSEDPLT